MAVVVVDGMFGGMDESDSRVVAIAMDREETNILSISKVDDCDTTPVAWWSVAQWLRSGRDGGEWRRRERVYDY